MDFCNAFFFAMAMLYLLQSCLVRHRRRKLYWPDEFMSGAHLLHVHEKEKSMPLGIMTGASVPSVPSSSPICKQDTMQDTAALP